MSYLSQLQEALRAPTPFGAALSRVGQSALEYSAADLAQRQQEELRRQQEAERQRQLSQQQVQFIQQRLPDMRRAGMFKEMAGLLPTYRQATKTAYGIDIPGGDVVGAPIYGPRMTVPAATPPISSDLAPVQYGRGPGLPTERIDIPPQEIGRDFSGAMTRRALDERFMLPPEQPEYKSVGGALFDPITKKFLVPPTQLTAAQKITREQERNITNLKRQQISTSGALERAGIMAGAGITRANIAASAGLTRAQMSAQQQELNRAQRASQFADALEARINMFGENLTLRKTAAEQKIDTEIAKAAPGAFSNVTNQLKGQKLEAAITTVADEKGLPNYVMSFDSPDAVKKARSAAQANGFAVGAYPDDPNTIVLMPQRGMKKEIPLVVTGAGTYGQRVVGQTAKTPAARATQQGGGVRQAVGSKPLAGTAKEKEARNLTAIRYDQWYQALPAEQKTKAYQSIKRLQRQKLDLRLDENYDRFYIESMKELGEKPSQSSTNQPAAPAAPTKKSLRDY